MAPPPPPPRSIPASGLLVMGLFLGFQLDALARLVAPAGGGAPWVMAVWLTTLAEPVAIAVGWLVAEAALPRRPAVTRASAAAATVLAALLTAEHYAFLATGQRFRGGVDTPGPSAVGPLLGSLGAAVGRVGWAPALAFLATVVAGFAARPRTRADETGQRRWFAALALAAGAASLRPPVAGEVATHPLRALVSAALRPPPAAPAVRALPDPDVGTLTSPEAGARAPPGAGGEALRPRPLRYGSVDPLAPAGARALATLRDPGGDPRPNLILITLESVGAVGFLKAGRPDPRLAPNLAALAARGVTLSPLYGTDPVSLRAHVLLHSGGRVFTWEDPDEMARLGYAGPTLAGRLSAAGYETVAFLNCFDFNGFWGLYERAFGFSRLYRPAASAPRACRGRPLSAWACEEAFLGEDLATWLQTRRTGAPAFLFFNTTAGHYPYAVPAGHPRLHPPSTRRRDWESAVHYVDAALGELLAKMRRAGLLDDAILAVVGDHGQAFGERHPGNLGHGNHLYEENMRNFMLYVDFRREVPGPPIPRLGGLGDVAPTLLARAGVDPESMPGQDLLAAGYRPRIQFLHKPAIPGAFGLVDGQFKFFDRAVGGGAPRLFDLRADPREAADLSGRFPGRVAEYRALARDWVARANAEYVRHVPGYAAGDRLAMTPEDLERPGPRRLELGCFDLDGRFVALARVPPGFPLRVWTQGVGYGTDTDVPATWDGPGPRARRGELRFTAGRDIVSVPALAAGAPALEPGRWDFRIDPPGLPALARGIEVVAGLSRPARCE